MRLIDLDDYSHMFCGHDGEYEKWNIDPDAIIPDAVIPTIEPERKKGHWIKIHWKAFRCSECNKISEYSTDFCPNCGADMREGETDDRL